MPRHVKNRLRLRVAVTRHVPPALRYALRVHAFVAQLMARHSRGAARTRGLDLLLASSPAVFVNNLSRHYLLTRTPAAHSSSTGRTVIRGAVESRREVRRPNPSGADAVMVPLAGAAATRSRIQTLSRLIERRERVETIARNVSAPGAFEAAPREGGARELLSPASTSRSAVELPLAKHAERSPKHMAESSAVMRATPDVTTANSTRARALPASDRDIDRIAERVIGSIDRRIIAQRERLGRP
ncbi:MAG: hypothetical protein WDO56_07870 [Gammaproteobacteria bacterium]